MSKNDKDAPATQQELAWLVRLYAKRRLVDRPCRVKVDA